jgi:PilZ domain-containing protein
MAPGLHRCTAGEALLPRDRMNTAALSPSGTGPSPDALRNYLSERSRTELDALRADLDTRLLALENALTSPDECDSLESLVIDLARVAMEEAEAATRRAIFEAQVDGQAQVETARAEARNSIDAARTTAAALHRDLDNVRATNATLQKELDEARTALKAEREASSAHQKDLQKTKTALESERSALKALRREVEQAQAALTAAEEAAEVALQRATSDADRRLAAAEEASDKELRRAKNEFAEQLSRERATIDELTDAQAKLEPLLAAALNDADARSAEIEAAESRADALEQRWKETEQARDQAIARADATQRERDALARELETARKAAQTDADALVRAKQARQETDQKAEAAQKERDAALTDLKAARKQNQADAESLARAGQARREAEDKAEAAGKERDAAIRDLKAARKQSQIDSESLSRATQGRQEAEQKAEAAQKERDAALRELKATRKQSQIDSESLSRTTQGRQEAEQKAEAAQNERDAALRDLKAARKAALTETSALEASEKGREEADARAAAAIRERDALAMELAAASQASRDENAAAGARAEALNAERARLMRDWQEDVVRLEVATRERDVIAAERDAMAAELEALRQSTDEAQAEERARQQAFYDAAEQRIRELELRLLQPQFESDEDATSLGLGAANDGTMLETLTTAPSATHDPPRRASRQAFSEEVQVQIDGSVTMLVDLSITGAQVISPTALKPNRMVKVAMPMGENSVACRGKIVWARLEPPSAGRALCYRAGVLFTAPDEAAIKSFISYHIRSVR